MHFACNLRVVDGERGMVPSGGLEEGAVVGLVGGKFGVICRGCSFKSDIKQKPRATRTFKHAYNTHKNIIVEHMVKEAMIIECDCMEALVMATRAKKVDDARIVCVRLQRACSSSRFSRSSA
jgi:hypothetical protein